MTTHKVALGKLFDVGSSKRVLKSQWQCEGVPFYRGREITRLAADGFVDNELFISEDHYSEFADKYGVPKFGDIMITAIGTIGNSYIVREGDKFYFKDASVLWLKKTTDVSSEFINLWLKSPLFFDQLDKGNGATVDTLTIQKLQSVMVALPPLPEQQRIVGILDEAFEGIATAKANAEKNLHNARALFDSHLQAVFSQRGEGWVESKFDDLIESNVIGLTKSSREQGDEKSWRYVKMNNITRDNRFDFSSNTAVDATDEEIQKYHLLDGDFLFNTRNSYELVGKSCIYEADSGEMVLFNNNIMRVRFVSGIDARYVLLSFSSKTVAEALNAMKSGTTNVSAIYYKDLKSLIIPVPSIATQRKIADELNVLRDETQRLESIYQQKLTALDELKKSLLDQAFRGEL